MMKRWVADLSLVLAVSAIAAPALAAAPVAPWLWSRDSSQVHSVTLDFVRGSATIVRRSGPVRVAVEKRSARGQQHQVTIDVEDNLGRIRISDRYPAQLAWQWSECHPVTPRGNFWDSDVRLHVTIHAPEGVDIAARFMDDGSRR